MGRHLLSTIHVRHGALAQLGERYNGIVEVSGSIPLCSTTFCNSIPSILSTSDGTASAFYVELSAAALRALHGAFDSPISPSPLTHKSLASEEYPNRLEPAQ